jgi:hypothetical protein
MKTPKRVGTDMTLPYYSSSGSGPGPAFAKQAALALRWPALMQIRVTPPPPGQQVAALIEPDGSEPLESWIARERGWLREQLLEHGALLFRGFEIADPERFSAFLDAAALPRMDYPRGTSPREMVGDRVYTSTETRPDVAIPMHTEMSYTSYYPEAVAFCCMTPARVGGATPLADMRRVRDRLDPGLLEGFEQRGLQYVQIVPLEPTASLERSWPAMFGTGDRAEVEHAAAAQGIECSWLDDGALRITGICPALRPHPASGELVWFNQAHVFHLRLFEYLQEEGVGDAREQARSFRAGRSTADLEPYQCRYGDGGEIPDVAMKQVRAALDAETTRFDWQRGDLLLLDNFRAGHARDTFEGERRVLAALISNAWEKH